MSLQINYILLRVKELEEKIKVHQTALEQNLKSQRVDTAGRTYRIRRQGVSVIDRLTSKIRLSASDCWEWVGAHSKGGFGIFRATSDVRDPSIRVDKFIYGYLFGDLAANYEIEQTCGNRSCCQPAHMVVITRKILLADRHKKFCIHGHPRTISNVYVNPQTGHRTCRKCSVKAVNASVARRLERDPVFRKREMNRRRETARNRYWKKKLNE